MYKTQTSLRPLMHQTKGKRRRQEDLDESEEDEEREERAATRARPSQKYRFDCARLLATVCAMSIVS